jgi:single-stranded DNA-binding protein
MQQMNLAILEGNLTADAQVKDVNGKPLVSFTVANNFFHKSANDESKTETNFLEVEAWNQGERVRDMTKGRQVRVTGRMKLEKWTTGDPAKPEYHSRFKIVATSVELGYFPNSKEEDEANIK